MAELQSVWKTPKLAIAALATSIGMLILTVPTGSAAPRGCEVAPRPASEFVLPTDPTMTGGNLEIIEAASQLPGGIPASDVATAEAQAFAELYVACRNAGDLRRLTALYSDSMFQSFLGSRMSMRFSLGNPLEKFVARLENQILGDTREEAVHLAQDITAPPAPLDPPINSVLVHGVRMLPNGRLGAILIEDGQPTEFHIYSRFDGRLLLDRSMTLRLPSAEITMAAPRSPGLPNPAPSGSHECTIAPMQLSQVETSIANATPEITISDDGVTVEDLPAGRVANQDTVEAVLALERQFAACLSVQDWSRVMSMLTGSGLRMLVDGQERSANELFLATPVQATTVESEWGMSYAVEVAEVHAVQVLDDGRIGAIVVWEDPPSPGIVAETFFHIYERAGDELLIDDEITVYVP